MGFPTTSAGAILASTWPDMAGTHAVPSSLAQAVILAVIPPGLSAPNQTALNGMPSQPELPRPYWTGLSGRLAVIS
jgi:hypothetical protein